MLLRKKKFQEQILSKTDGQLENLERMVHDVEFAQVEIRVIDGLKIGNTALKKLQEVLTIEEIEKVMDDTKEAVDKQNELDDLLMGTLTDEDETEAEAELDALIAQEAAEAIPEVPEDVVLPDVPQDNFEKETTEEKGTVFTYNSHYETSLMYFHSQQAPRRKKTKNPSLWKPKRDFFILKTCM